MTRMRSVTRPGIFLPALVAIRVVPETCSTELCEVAATGVEPRSAIHPFSDLTKGALFSADLKCPTVAEPRTTLDPRRTATPGCQTR
jgi:hypothetical protein